MHNATLAPAFSGRAILLSGLAAIAIVVISFAILIGVSVLGFFYGIDSRHIFDDHAYLFDAIILLPAIPFCGYLASRMARRRRLLHAVLAPWPHQIVIVIFAAAPFNADTFRFSDFGHFLSSTGEFVLCVVTIALLGAAGYGAQLLYLYLRHALSKPKTDIEIF